MLRSERLPRLAAALLSSLLAACGPHSWKPPGGRAIEVAQVRQLGSCNSDGPQTRLSLLVDREAVRVWQQAHHVDLVGIDPLPDAGAYVLVELGVRDSAGYGLAIVRQAGLGGGVVWLGASLFKPDAAEAARPMAASPCVLVALPEGRYRGVELRDPAGTLLAGTDHAPAPAQ